MAFRQLANNELFIPDIRLGHRLPIRIRGSEPADIVAYAAYRFGRDAYYLGFNIRRAITVDDQGRRPADLHRPRIEWSEDAIPFEQLLVDDGT